MSKPVLAIDIDDVLYPFSSKFLTFVNVILGEHKTLDDIGNRQFEEMYNLTRAETLQFIKYFMNIEREMDYIEPIHGSISTIQELAKVFDLQVVTARYSCYAEQTQDWINKYFPGLFSKIHYCEFNGANPSEGKTSKLKVCREIKAVCLIDDNVHNTFEVASGNIPCILFGEYSWNKDLPEGFKPLRLKSWSDANVVLMPYLRRIL